MGMAISTSNPHDEEVAKRIGALHQMLDAKLTALIDQLDMLTLQISKQNKKSQ